MTRHRLANRRALESFTFKFAFAQGDMTFRIALGRELVCIDRQRLGPVREVFLNAEQVNSAVDALASDGAILISLLLQHGCTIETIDHAMKRNPNGSPSSVFGRVAALIAEAEGS